MITKTLLTFCFYSVTSVQAIGDTIPDMQSVTDLSFNNRDKDSRLLQAKLDLVSGNIESFLISLSELRETDYVSMVLVLYYSWAVELRLSIDPVDFEKQFKAYEKWLRTRHAGDRSDQHRFYKANLLASLGDADGLRALTTTPTTGTEANFIDGYIHLQLAELTGSRASATQARQLFVQPLEQYTGKSLVNQKLGRIALLAARTELVLFGMTADIADIESARVYSRIARSNLELHTTPVFYATALSISADIEEAFLNATINPKSTELALRMAAVTRMRSLASQYR